MTAVLFVDIVEATPLAVSLGDRGWAELLEQYHELVHDTLARHRGRLMDTAGDGFFAIFDDVVDALGCALEIRDCARPLALELRAGVHLGHCWNADDKCAEPMFMSGRASRALPTRARCCSRRTPRNAPAGQA